MHIGTLLCGVSENNPVFSEWMPRRADNAVFTAELIHTTNAELTVRVLEKNSEDTGSGTVKGTLVAQVSTPGLTSATFTGLKELIRFEIDVTSEATGVAGVLYRFLPATWFDTARAGAP